MNKPNAVDAMMDALPKVDGLKPILFYPVFGVMVGVRYPYRKSPDVYMVMKGYPVHCCQCDSESFPVEELLDHIRLHDRRTKGQRAVVTFVKGDGVVVIGGFASEDDGSGRWEPLCSVWGICKPIEEEEAS